MRIERTTAGPVPADARQHMVPMRDGVALAADLYTDEPQTPLPVVLIRLPYDKNGAYCFMPEIARYFAARGFAAVIQDVRGKYRSEGATEFGVHEVADGFDTLEWVSRQPWCTGDVVMFGDSYFGMTQLAAAASGHPALRAIVPRVTGTRLGAILPHSDGSADPEQTSLRFYYATHFVDQLCYDWEIDLAARPLASTFEEFFTALGHRSSDYDIEVAAPGRGRCVEIEQLLAAPPVPTLYTVGWFDNSALWSWWDIERLMQHAS